jgi:hypothetical protein
MRGAGKRRRDPLRAAIVELRLTLFAGPGPRAIIGKAEQIVMEVLVRVANARQPIEVCITVDTEFSIGGNFYNPALLPVAEPIVLGEVDGKEHGLGFLIDSFADSGVRATFFVEALQTAYFGDEPMGEIARRIADAGHDVQLHLHPCWLHYEACAEPGSKTAPNDSCAGRTDAELDHLFERGLSAFSRWRLAKPVAVRAGNFQADAAFYRAAARSGVGLSSSITLHAGRPRGGHASRIGSVLELPVFSYVDPLGRHHRHRVLSITGSSYTETVSVLRQARDRGISPVIILTHPQEYIKRKDARYAAMQWDQLDQSRLKAVLQYADIRPNRINQGRLEGLLKFLSRHKSEFATVPLSELAQQDAAARDPHIHAISVSPVKALTRMFENGISDRVGWY